MRLTQSFFGQDVLTVAELLIGKLLIRNIEGQEIVCRVVETEAYSGPEDKACHAYGGRRTKRTEIMFASGGVAYIYLIYGMHYCLNIITGPAGKPEGALIRAVKPLTGLDIIKKNRCPAPKRRQDLTNGPGKLCQALKIDKALYGYNVAEGKDLFFRQDGWAGKIVRSPRINIDYAEEYTNKLWRFYMADNKYVSRP